MGTFRRTRRRLVQYRICAERGGHAGRLPRDARELVDECFESVAAVLEAGRVEIEAAGPVPRGTVLAAQFMGACEAIARRLFEAVIVASDGTELAATARRQRRSARQLMMRLRERLAAAA